MTTRINWNFFGIFIIGSPSQEITLPPERMDSSTDLLHHNHHQFPPTFSRLPPDGDEFPNNCWSDEKSQPGGVSKKLYRTDFSTESAKSPSSEPGSPPPLPTSEPPREDYPIPSSEVPPLPQSVPPLPPPKKATLAGRRGSFDDRKKIFESSPREIINSNMNGSNTLPTPPKPNDEPSKKSVRDKIAMFSSRSSSEDSAGDVTSPSILPKQVSNHVSSLSKSTVNISNSNGFSKSSENLLGGISSGRKSSVDLSLAPTYSPSPVSLSTTTPLCASLSTRGGAIRSPTDVKTSSNLYERSQSMIEVNGDDQHQPVQKRSSYQNPINPTQGYNTRPAVVSSLMEQRRKCTMTKLRGLVIPDGPDTANHNGHGINNNTSVSVVDLPTIISKDAVILPQVTNHYNARKPSTPASTDNSTDFKKSLSRTESLDRFSSMSYETTNSLNSNRFNTLQSAKTTTTTTTSDLLGTDSSPNTLNSFPNILPKYSPAFKRRGLSSYQSSLSASTLPSKITPPTSNATPMTMPQHNNSQSNQRQEENHKNLNKPVQVKIEKEPLKDVSSTKGVNGKTGKLEDSDNDSAVSSSRSSISHGLSPPNSPTPGESTAATPDPDLGSDDKTIRERREEAMNLDDSWRILKPTSIEAINRKNVLKSAKFSSGVGMGGGPAGSAGDDSSLSSNGKNRRSDDEDASYADAETEDTESSCSELEGSGNRRRTLEADGHNGRRDSNRADTTEDDDDESPQQSAVNMEFTELTESPLQAILDMEVKMAYINEVCDALNDGRGRTELSSRYFSRRDSEATVIERPIEPKRKSSSDTVDGSSAERRARNRSSSGNESDFSSNVSVGSQPNSHKPLSRETSSSTGTDTERWSLLEKKYSRSMTSVNNLGSHKSGEPQTSFSSPQHQGQLTSATSVPKIVTSASEVVEKKIEKIIEKSSEGVPKKTNATIPRGRNDFKSISEKWQKIEKFTDSSTPSSASLTNPITAVPASKPVIPDKPLLSPQSSSGSCSISSTPRSLSSQLTSPPPTTRSSSTSSPSPTKSLANILDSQKSSSSSCGESPIPSNKSLAPTNTSADSALMKAKLEAMEADRAWAEKRRSDGEPTRVTGSGSSTKRSVSVNDIRKAFEKAEIAVNSYGREESSPAEGSGKNGNSKDGGALALPAAHFRVSSFDSTTSEESSAATPAGMYGSSNSLVSSAPRDPYGSITSLASSTSLISPQVRRLVFFK